MKQNVASFHGCPSPQSGRIEINVAEIFHKFEAEDETRVAE